MDETRETIREQIVDSVTRAAQVFYVDGLWRPFDTSSPESRVTKPDPDTHVQFNNVPGRIPHAEYRGPFGRWWVRIDPTSGLPIDDPIYAPSPSASSQLVN